MRSPLPHRLFLGIVAIMLSVLTVGGTFESAAPVFAAISAPTAHADELTKNSPSQNTGIHTVQMLSHPLTAPPATTTGNGLGEPGFYTLVGARCGCSVKVNVANGNLVVHTTDLKIKGTGIDLGLTKFYNSLAGNTLNLGQNWVLGTGGDISLHVNGDGSVTYNGADAYAAVYATNGSGGYTNAPGLNATLVKNGDGTFTLTFHKNNEKLSFAASGSLSSDADKNGNKITFTYNGSNQLTSLTDTQGRTTTFSYTTSGYINTITDPTSRTVKYGYDTSNRLTTSTDLNGKTTTFGYTGSDLTSITDPDTNLTTIGYDGNHRVTSITDADNATTKFTFNSGNTVVTDGNNHNTTYTYDSQDRVTQVKDALSHSQSTTYTPNSNVSQTTDALTNQTNSTFDVNNNLTSTTDATGAASTLSYTDTNHPYYATSQSDAQGNSVAYTYDSTGNLSTSQDGLSSQNKVTYTYNSNGTVATTTDGNSNKTTYGYDSHGNLTTVTPPNPLGAETITYDGISRVSSFTDGKNQKTSYAYDNLDRVTLITYADSSTVTYTYDNDGNVTSVADSNIANNLVKFTYDGVNQQVNRTVETVKPLNVGESFSYSYDAVGNLLSIVKGNCPNACNASGKGTYYDYNSVNLLSDMGTEVVTDGVPAKTQQSSYGYDNNNRRTSVNYANGVTMTLSYDNAGHETGITAKNSGGITLTSFTYSYFNPATGKATGIRYSVKDANNNTTKYTYDALNRLTDASVFNSGGTKTADYAYAYDGNGNRTSATLPSGSTSYAYNAANEMNTSTSSGATTTYSYDGDGNTTGATNGLTLAYNTRNQTTSITPSGQSAVSLTYRGTNQDERLTAGNNTFDNDIQGVLADTNATYIRDNKGNLVAENPSGSTYYYYLFDGLGSVVGLTDGSGNLVATYQYDPYGNLTGSTGSVSNPWLYAGGYYDSNTGLYKFGARYYNPGLGRWTQPDPAVALGNRYFYAGDSPTNLVDPSGTTPLPGGGNFYVNLIPGPFFGIPTGVTLSFDQNGLVWAGGLGAASIGLIIEAIGIGTDNPLLDVLGIVLPFALSGLTTYAQINCPGSGASVSIYLTGSPTFGCYDEIA